MWLNISIDDVLNVWCRRWASQRDIKGYPSLQPFMRESKHKITRFTISELDDESYLRIDKALEILRQRDLTAYRVLMAKFLQHQEVPDICIAMNISKSTYDNYLKSGRMFMEGAVFGAGIIRIKF
ncbi:antitermination protein [Mannheimia indoligenes]|uniref:antitermination protein n=1 Tax=Mannheimia indoligenes TaxID=3103145 RepID=UPI002FE663BE